MSSILNKLKETVKSDRENKDSNEPEQQFSTQPHPAKTNNPADLAPAQPGQGMGYDENAIAFNTPGPYIPGDQVKSSLGQPQTRDELRARTAELNKEQ
ncbi:hypothetical protein SISNIDRAFT_459131 [Sistotremastrum niveocremeum HHB9708]|uniref:Uncharacterized protein n=1 Tax=Sistotremastrum niveocremeum HHB9708 TaxID=1314777 RepID=A0A164PY46_9AGAM|nr:hypothetical protein SISNIDRAFT_459131 [Sistotremastrum niveocremeum HHB9708]